jgi:hypothetical protein
LFPLGLFQMNGRKQETIAKAGSEGAATELSIVDVYSLYKELLEKFVKDRRKAEAERRKKLPWIEMPSRIPFPLLFHMPSPFELEMRKDEIPPFVEAYSAIPFIRTGGSATLSAFQKLDMPTLELLASLNHANQMRLQQVRFNRRVKTGIFAGIAALAGSLNSSSGLREIHSLWLFLSRSMIGTGLLAILLFALYLFLFFVIQQVFYLRPRIRYVGELGHLLDFAITRARSLHHQQAK